MTHPLVELRDELLKAEHPDQMVEMADYYLVQFEELGDKLHIPRKYAFVQPVVEYYADNHKQWLDYVMDVRDRTPSVGAAEQDDRGC